MAQHKISFQKSIVAFALIALGFIAGSMFDIESPANADLRKTPPRQAFQSGAERSEVYLKEMAGSLKRIEARLVQIEGKIVSLKKTQ